MGEPREPPENGNPFPLAETAEEEVGDIIDGDCKCMGMTCGGERHGRSRWEERHGQELVLP